VRALLKYWVLVTELAVAAACENPMQPQPAVPRDRDCEVFAAEPDSLSSPIPFELRCGSRVRVVCG
jgi:hypothetical protein